MSLYSVRPSLTTGLVVAAAATAAAAPARGSGHEPATPPPVAARIAITTAKASGSTLSVRGRVRLTHATPAVRKRARVLVTLTATAHKSERRTVKIGAGKTFGAKWTTKLQGRLTIAARVVIGGKAIGRRATRKITVAQPVHQPSGGTPLIGTFKLDAGAAPSGQAPTGSYFEMLQPNGAPLANLSSPAPDKNYTPLTPGSDAGLRTDSYQAAPTPAFSGGSSGNALAGKIIRPVPFYLVDFSVETSATDAQLGVHDPLPSIKAQGGRLTGEITAWVAQWNGQSFNQGTPKPDGRIPAPTTPVGGTYDPATRRFTLAWKSLIVGGPFNGFTGAWHLTGTFVPVPTGSGLLPLPLPTL